MGIHVSSDPLEDADIEDLLAADELLADVLKEFSRDFRKANEANREVAGDYVAYTVSIDGKVVYTGRGEVFPENQVAGYIPGAKSQRERQRERNVELGQKLKEIIVNWAWSQVQGRAFRAGIRKATFAIGTSFDPEYAGDALKIGNRLAKLATGSNDSNTEFDVIFWIAQELVSRSPVLTDTYQSSHTLFVDGAEAGSADDVLNGADIPAGSEYVFVNGTAYATKLESGRTKQGRDFLTSVPNRIYEGVARDAISRFGEVATIEFGMEDVREVNHIASSPVITVRPR